MNRIPRHVSAVVGLCLVVLLSACSSGNGITAPPTTTTTTTPPITTTTAKAKFAYTGNQGASISGYSVDTSSGALTPLNGFPFVIGVDSTTITHDPQGRFLILGDVSLSKLHVLAINSASGALTEISPSPYPTIQEPIALAVDPAGTHVYAASMGGNQVGAYSLSSTGVLTPIAGSPFPTGSTGATPTIGSGILIDAAGKFLYLQDLNNIYTFSINSSSGALTLIQTLASPAFGNAIAIDPAGTYLYAVGDGTPTSIFTYSINASSGLLTLAKSSPMAEHAGAYTISVSPTGQFAYTIENNNYLVSYAISNGVFTPVGTVYSGIYGQQIAIDPSGSFVYVPQGCSNCQSGIYNVVYEFAIGSGGGLTKISNSPVAAGTTPWGITVTSQ